MRKVYISGKITGIEDHAPKLFSSAEFMLQAKGFLTVNPLSLNHNHNRTWHDYMKEDVKAICDCDAVFMLNNWKDSRGAKIEHEIASYLGLDIMYQEEN